MCIDESQKLPGLLDEVHRLIEARGWRFALTGSSARKLKHAKKWDPRWERGARELAATSAAKVKRMYGVYTGKESYTFDGYEVLPVPVFLDALAAGEVF